MESGSTIIQCLETTALSIQLMKTYTDNHQYSVKLQNIGIYKVHIQERSAILQEQG
jgi:hypothetical protein